jgi:NRPS condensation-like uncharacterized protein
LFFQLEKSALEFTMTDAMRGRFNSFQKTMLHWNELHPYNAIHVVHIEVEMELHRAGAAINGTLQRLGLTGFMLDRDTARYEFSGGEADCEIKTVSDGGNSRDVICAEITRQLNRPFPQAVRFDPFRFFIVTEPGAFSLGVTVFHAIADAESIVGMLRGIAEAYVADGSPSHARPVTLYPATGDSLIRRPGMLLRKLAALPSQITELRHSFRPRYRDPNDFRNGCAFFSLDPESLASLIAQAKAHDVTLNDFLLAALLKCVSALASNRERARRRRKISIGCIVNTRKDLGSQTGNAFGVSLGSFMVTHDIPANQSVGELAKEIAWQTGRIKQHKLYLAMPLELALGRFLLRFFSTEQRRKLYQKHYPLWGGITNMNLNNIWPQREHGDVSDYFRAVSTGPVTPLVLSLTTFGDHANVALTYRSTVFSETDVEAIERRFLESIPCLTESA